MRRTSDHCGLRARLPASSAPSQLVRRLADRCRQPAVIEVLAHRVHPSGGLVRPALKIMSKQRFHFLSGRRFRVETPMRQGRTFEYLRGRLIRFPLRGNIRPLLRIIVEMIGRIHEKRGTRFARDLIIFRGKKPRRTMSMPWMPFDGLSPMSSWL